MRSNKDQPTKRGYGAQLHPVAGAYSSLGRPTGRVHGQVWGKAIRYVMVLWPLAFSVNAIFVVDRRLHKKSAQTGTLCAKPWGRDTAGVGSEIPRCASLWMPAIHEICRRS